MNKRFDLYLDTPNLGVVHAADVAVVEQAGRLDQVGLRYRPDYLDNPAAFAIDPVQLPLQRQDFSLACRGGTPAFIDDYLPDAWGRRILARLALTRQGRRLNANSVIDALSLAGASRIGAVSLVNSGDTPDFEYGAPMHNLRAAEQAAQHLDQADDRALDANVMGLLYLAHSGTGVGGARPKALLYDDSGHYLAKFNRQHDEYNNARVELACLNMARAAGLDVTSGRVVSGIGGREALLLDRFDVVDGGEGRGLAARHHMVTANGLLKEPATQRDPGHGFRYDDVCDLLRRHSCQVETDMQQLLRLMLFNAAINNTDDHERNVSLMHCGHGYRLAPAYDLVPSLVMGAYHAAGFGYAPNLPLPSTVSSHGRVFGLSRTTVARIADQVRSAIEQWPDHAEQAGVAAHDAARVGACLRG